MDIQQYMLLISIALPAILAVWLFFIVGDSENIVQKIALIGFAVPMVFSIILGVQYFQSGVHGSEYLFEINKSTGLDAFGIRFHLGLNGVSVPLYMLAGVVGFAAGIYAIFSKAERLKLYLSLLLIMHSGLMGVFASIDLFFFYFFHEFALIPTFIMIGIWGGQGRRSAAIEMTVYLTLGAMLSLIGLVALYIESGQDTFSLIALKDYFAAVGTEGLPQSSIFALLLFGFGILVSLFPFHSWAPRGYAASPSSVAMLHAGVLKKFGLYGLIQVAAPLLPEGLAAWSDVLIVLALGNVIIMGFVTMAQRDLKLMIGNASVMHMGYAFLGLASFSVMGAGGAVMFMVGHGLSAALMFMLSTSIFRRTKTYDMQEMGGLGARTPILAGFFVAATMAGIGLPGFANFWGELSIFTAVQNSLGTWVAAGAILGIIISAIYGLRAVAKIFFGEPAESFKEIADSGLKDVSLTERVAAGVLLLALVVVGLWPSVISDSINQGLSRSYDKMPFTVQVEQQPAPNLIAQDQ